jgi:hypothetical protein
MTEYDETYEPAEEEVPRKRGRILKRIGLTLLAIVGLLAVTAAVLYNFGSMETPSPEMRAQYQTLVAEGKASAVQPAGFHVPIPGCKCHSDDPVLTMQHEGRKIRECSSCHGGAGPEQAQAVPAY